ncbi:phage baseplate assembly protein [Edwardsiella anguillarum]|uniref:Phage late control protein D protein n=1 Tax=Edwardsiella anguillarum ET080813 TaxID=667120 RepID=A0A076LMV6_9GAMM|nr:contractile injection system protein, VgrG/Pvc8 family [Edwardsiella anguillarum]AIJ09256.1 phage late control protein D protein [Edwardsiella anguillarum ET080813]KAB0589390.1 phage tail protein [Edwardsiella anguillarum]
MASNVELFIDGVIFTGWISVRVTRSIERLAGDFELDIMMPGQPAPHSFRTGQPLKLTINGQTVITGYLDVVKQKITEDSLTVSVQGRDKTGDLVDCSAIYAGGQWRNRTLAQIAEDLCRPFGIKVIWALNDTTAAKPFTSFTLELSETVSDALTRAARHRGVLVTSNADGDLVFTQAGNIQTDTLTLGENLLACDYSDDWRNRYSEYQIKGHSGGGGKSGDAKTAALIAAPKGKADDHVITRYRPRVILADHKIDAASARQRALREERRALARSISFTAQLRGWFRDNGKLWEPNLLTRVSAARVGVDVQALLISRVEFALDIRSGETTTLTLAPRDAFIVPAEPDRSGAGSTGGGIDAMVNSWLNQGGKLDE